MPIFGRSILLLEAVVLLAFVGSSMSDEATTIAGGPWPTPPVPGPDAKCSKSQQFCGKHQGNKDWEYLCCEALICDKKASLWGPDGGVCRVHTIQDKNPDCMTVGEICGNSGNVTVTCCGETKCITGAKKDASGIVEEGICGGPTTPVPVPGAGGVGGAVSEDGGIDSALQLETCLLMATSLALAVVVLG